MTDNKLHASLDTWLAQFLEPAAEPEPDVLEVPDICKESARFFGFDPDALTWVNDNGWGVIALIDNLMVCFSVEWSGEYFARVKGHSSKNAYSQERLAEAIRFAQQVQRKQRENEAIKAAQADEYAKRPRVMQFIVAPDIDKEANKRLSHLLNNEGWVIAFAPVVIHDNSPLYCYTLIRD